jgi:hypothetical protein
VLNESLLDNQFAKNPRVVAYEAGSGAYLGNNPSNKQLLFYEVMIFSFI